MRRAFLAPYWRGLRDLGVPAVVEQFTPSHVAAVLGWDEKEAVRVVPMTDAEAAGPVERGVVGQGERRLRQVM